MPRNLPNGDSNETGVSKNSENADFHPTNCYISDTIEDRHIVTMETNRKSNIGFRLVPISTTFNGLERP